MNRLLVLGAGARAARIEALARKPGTRFTVAGYVGMNDGPVAVDAAVDRAAIKDIVRHAADLGAHEIVLALEERRNALPLADLLRLRSAGVRVHDFADFIEQATGRIDLDSLRPDSLALPEAFAARRGLASAAKRLLDILFSAAILLLTWPFLFLAALLTRLESKGPVLLRQRCIGRNGRAFDLLRLRTVRDGAQVGGIAVWSRRDDPRVTRIGSIARAIGIDALPQLWSVLKGEMSLVGPRPERPQFVSDLEGRLPFYPGRHLVKPGLTGWAEVNGPLGRSIEDARRRLEHDLYYARHAGPLLDSMILLRKVGMIARPAMAG